MQNQTSFAIAMASSNSNDSFEKVIAAIGELQITTNGKLERVRVERDTAIAECEVLKAACGERDEAVAECARMRVEYQSLKDSVANVTRSAIKYRKAYHYAYNKGLKLQEQNEKLIRMRKKLLSALELKSVVEDHKSDDTIVATQTTTTTPVVVTTATDGIVNATAAPVVATVITTIAANAATTSTVTRMHNKPIPSVKAMRSIGLSRFNMRKTKKPSALPAKPAADVPFATGSFDIFSSQ